MLGSHNAIYCDQCRTLEAFYYTVFTKEKIGSDFTWTAWHEVCLTCLKAIKTWNTAKLTSRIKRGSNLRYLGKRRFLHLVEKQKVERRQIITKPIEYLEATEYAKHGK